MPGAPRAPAGGAEPEAGGQEFESRHLRTRAREEVEERSARECVLAPVAGTAAASPAREGREGEPRGGLEARPPVRDVHGTSERCRPLQAAGLSRSETGRGPTAPSGSAPLAARVPREDPQAGCAGVICGRLRCHRRATLGWRRR